MDLIQTPAPPLTNYSKSKNMLLFRQQKIADREKRAAEQQRKKMEKEAQRLMKKEQNKIGVKLS